MRYADPTGFIIDTLKGAMRLSNALAPASDFLAENISAWIDDLGLLNRHRFADFLESEEFKNLQMPGSYHPNERCQAPAVCLLCFQKLPEENTQVTEVATSSPIQRLSRSTASSGFGFFNSGYSDSANFNCISAHHSLSRSAASSAFGFFNSDLSNSVNSYSGPAATSQPLARSTASSAFGFFDSGYSASLDPGSGPDSRVSVVSCLSLSALRSPVAQRQESLGNAKAAPSQASSALARSELSASISAWRMALSSSPETLVEAGQPRYSPPAQPITGLGPFFNQHQAGLDALFGLQQPGGLRGLGITYAAEPFGAHPAMTVVFSPSPVQHVAGHHPLVRQGYYQEENSGMFNAGAWQRAIDATESNRFVNVALDSPSAVLPPFMLKASDRLATPSVIGHISEEELPIVPNVAPLRSFMPYVDPVSPQVAPAPVNSSRGQPPARARIGLGLSGLGMAILPTGNISEDAGGLPIVPDVVPPPAGSSRGQSSARARVGLSLSGLGSVIVRASDRQIHGE